MTKPTLLMCPPDHFNVVYSINPWMDPADWKKHESEWHDDAAGQWQSLKGTFEKLGADIQIVNPEPDWPDMVFTANAGIWLDGRVLLARFRHEERQGEEPFFDQYFRSLIDRGLAREVGFFPDKLIQEGEGDCLWDPKRNLFWAGYGQRSALEANAYIGDFFKCDVVSLELVEPRYYHIDVSMCPLSTGHILYYPGAFSAQGREALLKNAGEEWLVPVEKSDADRMALNAVTIGQNIVMNDCSPELEARLGKIGFTVHRVPLPAFLKAGGSACCLSMRLDHSRGDT